MTPFSKNPISLRLRRDIWRLVIVFALLAIIGDIALDTLLAHRYRSDQEVSVALELGAVRARLEERLNTNLFLIQGMASYISVRSGISSREFNALAHDLLGRSNSLENIAAAPDFVIRYVYPLAGNEAILGLDYRQVPEQWPRALAAKESGRMAVAGPLDLVQGGRGLIARIPVFFYDSGNFWGLVSSVIDFDSLLDQAGLNSPAGGLATAIRGKDGEGDQGDIIWGDPALFDEKSEAVVMPVALPSGFWLMAAVPKAGWASHSPYLWLIHLSVLALSALGCLAAIHQHRDKLRIVMSENRLQAMSQASLDALITIDAQDIVTFWNPAAEEMFGYGEAEMIGKKLHDFIVLPRELEKIRPGLERFANTGQGPVLNTTMEMEAVRKSGEVFPVERSVASYQLQGNWYAVGSVRDITARKQFEKQLTELATVDSLTGLFNRRHFMEQAEALRLRAIRYGKHLSLLMFDLDHFKNINDTYGHDAGDKVLREVAETIRRELRETDVVGRIGGEEFTVAMPETDIEMARPGRRKNSDQPDGIGGQGRQQGDSLYRQHRVGASGSPEGHPGRNDEKSRRCLVRGQTKWQKPRRDGCLTLYFPQNPPGSA